MAVDATTKLKSPLGSLDKIKEELGDLTIEPLNWTKARDDLTVKDRGIGRLTAEEVDQFINQIAFLSRAEAFLKKYKGKSAENKVA
jgi:HSP90 family molecular chaperone